MPAATAATTRLRKSREYGAAMWAGLQSSPDLESYFRPRRNLLSRLKMARLDELLPGRPTCPQTWGPDPISRVSRVNLKRPCSKRQFPEGREVFQSMILAVP